MKYALEVANVYIYNKHSDIILFGETVITRDIDLEKTKNLYDFYNYKPFQDFTIINPCQTVRDIIIEPFVAIIEVKIVDKDLADKPFISKFVIYNLDTNYNINAIKQSYKGLDSIVIKFNPNDLRLIE